MIVTPIKTKIITPQDNLFALLDTYLPLIEEYSVIAVTSKIIAICEGRIVPIHSISKDDLIKKESQYFLPRGKNKYQVSFSITHNMLAASAGIDESNGDGYYILWPRDVQKSANVIRQHLEKRSGVKHIGVIITDSRTMPLRWGVTGVSLAHSGFLAVKDYVGKSDLFGRPFAYEKMHIADSLAAAATLVMGEGDEQIPLAIITHIPTIQFQLRNPTKEELETLTITKEDDLYGPFLNAISWKKGDKE